MGPQTKRLRNYKTRCSECGSIHLSFNGAANKTLAESLAASANQSEKACFNGAANKTLAELGINADDTAVNYMLQWGRKQNACGITAVIIPNSI